MNRETVPLFELDTSCTTIPCELKDVLAASQRPDALRMTEAQARARVARNRLMLALKQQNMTQADLARLTKESPTVISRVLQNPEKCRITTLRRLADALGVDLADVLGAPA